LTNVNERQYQIPFCQVLAAEGETILYISSHGPFEKGKDIITRTASGEIRAYQLKAGDVGLSEWREIYGEIVNLVELAIEDPSVGVVLNFSPYLVTNGKLKDPVIEQVRVANLTWQERGIHKTLKVVQEGELLDRFRASHGAYLPHNLEEFTTFLELVLREGSFPADKAKFARLLEATLPFGTEKGQTGLEVRRAAASSVLLAAYIVGSAQASKNHWAIFEYWVTAASYILRLGEEHSAPDQEWSISFELCERAAEDALQSLIKECKESGHLVQGSPLTDGHVYSARVTTLIGLFASMSLRHRLKKLRFVESDYVFGFIQRFLKHSVMWGESAVPYYLLAALELECNCRGILAEGLLLQLIRELAANNGEDAPGKGIPNVYYSAEQAIRVNTGLDFLNDEGFSRQSYTLASLVDILARRWRRQALASVWFSITRISLMTYVPASGSEFFRWRSSDGALESRFSGEPQSWSQLRDAAEALDFSGLPSSLIKRPDFALWFILVFPQRFSRELVMLLETALLRQEVIL
jgi:hypothetical protein